MGNSKEIGTWAALRWLCQIMSPYWAALLLGILVVGLNGILDGIMLVQGKEVIDRLASLESNERWEIGFSFACYFLGFVLLRSGTQGTANYLLAFVSGKVVMLLRQRLFRHFLSLPVGYIEAQPHGVLVSKLTYDTQQVAHAASSVLVPILRAIVQIVTYSVIMFKHNWKITLLALVISPIMGWLLKEIARRFRRLAKEMQSTMGRINDAADEMIRGHRDIIAFGRVEQEVMRFAHITNQMRDRELCLTLLGATTDPILQLVTALPIALIALVGMSPLFAIHGETMTIGTLGLLLGSMYSISRPLKFLASMNSSFQRGIAASQSLFAALALPKETDQGQYAPERVEGGLVFENVSFAYATRAQLPVLKNISLTIKPYSVVAFVGRSGAGKSSLLALLNRFYTPTAGRIFLDGIDLEAYNLAALRRQFAIVSQHIHLVRGTILENIAYGNMHASADAILAAAESAYVNEFAEQLPLGLQTPIGPHGVALSGGQRQRVAIARALLKDAPILIFDEATSALDVQSERMIQLSMAQLTSKKTILIVAHRLSTIEGADRIFLMDNGELLASGTHEELLQASHHYASFYHYKVGDLPHLDETGTVS